MVHWLRGLGGAALGGAAGYVLFSLLLKAGLYALVLPGALMGIGCGRLSGVRSAALGAVCGVLATAVGVFVEWRFRPFVADDSLPFFLQNLTSLSLGTLLMISAGGVLGFYFGQGLGNEAATWNEPGNAEA